MNRSFSFYRLYFVILFNYNIIRLRLIRSVSIGYKIKALKMKFEFSEKFAIYI